LVDFAKENKYKTVASNVPRRYASMVYKGGFGVLDTLENNEKEWIAPLPITYDATLPGYVKMLEMMGGHGGENLPKAQAVKDATMAYFILKNLSKESLIIHYNGAYHSDNYEGIMWYLKKENPELKILTITSVSTTDVTKFDSDASKADFVIQVSENMTKTYR
jgi:uncharacterized iron-regulated protein